MVSRKLRIAFVLPNLAGGGAQRVMMMLAGNLDRDFFDVVLVVLDATGEFAGDRPDAVPLVDLGTPRMRHARSRLRLALCEFRPDVVVATMTQINIGVLMQRLRLPKKTRIIVREANTPSASLAATGRPWFYRFLYRRYYPRADAVLCPSQRVAEEFRRQFGLDGDRLHVMEHPIDVDVYRTRAAPPVRTPGDGGRFVAAGRMTDQKGFDRLIDLLPALPGDLRLTLLGDGPQLPALREQAHRLGVADRLQFAGFVENPWAHYAGADAFLLPSRWEGMPNAALEALAVGCPVIAAPEAGGIVEVAARAPTGAVTIAEPGPDFVAAVCRLAPTTDGRLRDSLLPPAFALMPALRRFEDLLRAVAAAR